MFSISQDFAPPFKLISPFFIIGSIFYLFSVLFLFFITGENITMLSGAVLGFVHLFLLGFVMMIIFGAMAQLVPVVLEVGHFGVELFYAIWPLLMIGTLLMVLGFVSYPMLLPFGGVTVLIAIMIFIVEIFLTIKKVLKLNIIMSSVLIANIFLLIGIIFGLLMALSYAGIINLNISALLRSHVFSVIGGYVTITLMGLSIVLLPMFGLSHGFSLKPLKIAIGMMSAAVLFVILSSFTNSVLFEYFGYLLATAALLIYFYLVQIIYKTRARKEIDIYAKSLIIAYFSMLASLALATLYLIVGYEPLLLGAGWLMFFGFFGFAITGHIYKIVPFLVWFERFSPLVGKQKVPMLADMLPKKSSSAQVLFCGVGVVVVAVAILLKDDMLIKAGASFLLIGAAAFVRSIFYMINYK
ncbi:MFS transporter [Sulfurimonas sp.]|uniref:MFS transporter n=1 Tax=Sulfurimonas sp. TaxID=2022749 RepID=UPI00261491D2|nr:MFS transporter [Sulfurimonas sp.]MDD5156701.1 MFS transporter [Sulfurimonas sp.]